MPLTTDTNWIIVFCCRLGNYPLLELALAWATMDLILEGRKIYVFCICVGVTVCVCLPCCPEVLDEDLDDKNSVGHPCQPVWSGAHAAPLPLPFSACLSHFVQRNKKKNSGRRGAIGEEHKAWQSHSHRLLIHNSINVENLFLRCSAVAQREVCWWAQKKPLLPSVTEIWMSIRVCVTIWTFAFVRS